jgi:cyclopropane fatty-acyl-phospholipid synthase-like methyltransferase
VTAVRADRYKHLFTKELLMGPNAVRLLEEMLENHPIRGGRVLDLGCGTGLTSLFLARETGAEQIFAVDLWIPATENWKRIREWGEERKIIPLHADARDLPFPEDFFDVIVSMDSYHYYGCQERFFAEKMLPLIRPGGRALLLVPGLKREFEGDAPELLVEWLGDDISTFHDGNWWRNHIAQGCEDRIEVEVFETRQFEQPWQDWFDCGHEYGLDDQKFFSRGVDQFLSFIAIAVRVKEGGLSAPCSAIST